MLVFHTLLSFWRRKKNQYFLTSLYCFLQLIFNLFLYCALENETCNFQSAFTVDMFTFSWHISNTRRAHHRVKMHTALSCPVPTRHPTPFNTWDFRTRYAKKSLSLPPLYSRGRYTVYRRKFLTEPCGGGITTHTRKRAWKGAHKKEVGDTVGMGGKEEIHCCLLFLPEQEICRHSRT